MKRIISILLITTLFAGELEVDGGLVVTESVTASSFVGDGSGLTNLQSLGGEKPEKIYVHNASQDDVSWSFVVPSNKLWVLHYVVYSSRYININNSPAPLDGTGIIYILPNTTISSLDNPNSSKGYYSFLEYSIESSGSDQGMDYIIP